MRRLLVVTLGCTLAALTLLAPRTVRPAYAAEIWDVQVAGDVVAEGIMANTYFPDTLTVHAGDTVRWTWATNLAPHTVTFPSGNAAPSLLMPGADPGSLQAADGFFTQGPVGPDNAGSYDGSRVVGSGVPLDPSTPPFQLTFSQVGEFAYVCLAHPGMQGHVEVLPAGAPLAETPAQATARGQAEFAGLVDALRPTIAGASSPQAAPPGGPATHLIAAGVSNTAGMSALLFLPGSLTVHRGDLVVWAVEDPFELHTVTFTSGAPAPAFLQVTPQPAGPPLPVIAANVFSPVGGSAYNGSGYVNSGFFGPGAGYFLTITAPPGTYTYQCLIHGPNPMQGTITVVP